MTPPYHFYNVRYLETVYGMTAEEAVRESPRDFNFVLNEEQFKRAADLVDMVAMSRPQSDQRSKEEIDKESENAMRDMKALCVSKGRVTILDSRIKAPAGDKDLGAIKWLKFKVELQVPCTFSPASGSDVAVDASKCGGRQKQ